MKVLRTPVLGAIAAALALALGGCGSQAGSAGGGSTSSPPGLTTSAPSPSTLPEQEPAYPPNASITAGATVTLVGIVNQGAEPSCLILQTRQGLFELLSPTPVPHAGDHVTVTGHVVKAMSHCMQGSPFLVERLAIG